MISKLSIFFCFSKFFREKKTMSTAVWFNEKLGIAI